MKKFFRLFVLWITFETLYDYLPYSKWKYIIGMIFILIINLIVTVSAIHNGHKKEVLSIIVLSIIQVLIIIYSYFRLLNGNFKLMIMVNHSYYNVTGIDRIGTFIYCFSNIIEKVLHLSLVSCLLHALGICFPKNQNSSNGD